ncbi:response regulator [Sneathiella sp. P13V-1]|uniref:response regulator n=1 Tax=Sneathiella sp. P13V-1 TaxID=2697366 RepID=UPI00187B40C2|nr:response regulator [Sneathiella sp. P13V-1]MBE7635448.1 response regulator [Sneathiella sp. P13V-1]
MDKRFEPASVLLYDPQATMRHNTRVALLGVGFGSVEAVGSLEEFTRKAKENSYDLIVADTKGPEGRVNEIVEKIRLHKVGENPFANIIVTTWNTAPEEVQKVISSGVDDLVGRPMSTQQISERVAGLVSSRKPFVVAEDYVGPERRSIGRVVDGNNQLIVPNSLKAKVENRPELDATPGNIKLAISAVNERKVSIYTERFVQLSKKVMSLTGGLEDLETRRKLVLQMLNMTEDLIDRIKGTELEHLLPLAEALDKVLEKVGGSATELSDQDRELMYQIPFALHKASEQVRMSAEMRFDIARLSQEIKTRPVRKIGFSK